jgi:hypothetical protein
MVNSCSQLARKTIPRSLQPCTRCIDGTVAIQVEELLTSVWKCKAIERTKETESRGKYLFIFKETDMEKAKESIGNLIKAFGRASGRECAEIALEKLNEFPEFDSIQRVSMSVQSKGLGIRAMLESAVTQRTAKSNTKVTRPIFQFHVNTELQKQLPITTQKPSYSSIVKNQSTQKKQLTIVSPQQKAPPTTRHQQASPST